MRILQVIHQFLPKSQAGSEIYTYHLAKELSKRHEVHLFYPEDDPQERQYKIINGKYDGLPYTQISYPRRYFSLRGTYRNSKMDKVFSKLLDEQKPDIIHFQHLLHLSTNFVLLAKERNIPMIYTIHDYWMICPTGQLLKENMQICLTPAQCTDCHVAKLFNNIVSRRFYLFCSSKSFTTISAIRNYIRERAPDFLKSMLRKLIHRSNHNSINPVPQQYMSQPPSIPRSSMNRYLHKIKVLKVRKGLDRRRKHMAQTCNDIDLFIAPSEFIRKEHIKLGIPANKIVYSDYGFSKAWCRNIPRSTSDKVRFAYLGTINPHKGLHILIEAFNKIDSKKAELHIYGDLTGLPIYCGYVQKIAQNQNIIFHGRIENHQLREALMNTDALVVPSIWFENSPLVIHEAFLAGIPVITSNIGGMAELVKDGLNGLLFEIGSVSDLKMKLQMVVDDPDILKKLNHFPKIKSIEEDAENIEKIYCDLLEQSKRIH